MAGERPRDALGRPLPYGAVGVPALPADAPTEPYAALAEAQRLLDEGMPFQAHEVLEGAWKAAPDAERALWQGLAQLAVALTHSLRGNEKGALTLLQRGRLNVTPYAADPPYGLDLPALLTWSPPAPLTLTASM